MIRTFCTALALALLALPLAAQDFKVGDNAEDIPVNNWVNAPEQAAFSELQGDVILIKAWGIN